MSQIKKCWAISSIIYLIFLLFDSFMRDPYMGFLLQSLVIPFGYLFLEILNFSALFWFSYKNQKTALLTFNIGLAFVRTYLLASPFFQLSELQSIYANQASNHFLRDCLINCLYLLIVVQWIVLSFLLRKENKLIRKNEILSRPEHQKAMQDLAVVNNLADLPSKFIESVHQYPQIEKELKKIYEQRQLDRFKGD